MTALELRTSSDFLLFCSTIAQATIENNTSRLSTRQVDLLLRERKSCRTFIADTFDGIFFSRQDLQFLDRFWCNLSSIGSPQVRSLALAALTRACVKRQPRGVFTVAGDAYRYDDGRRDLRLDLEQHFIEQVQLYNATVFDNGRRNIALRRDVFELQTAEANVDLVYLDPPYVPRSDDNCYIKRYHFLEGLSRYWKDEEILLDTKVRKIRKKYTPFSYRRDAIQAFERLFSMFRSSILVLSYSSNGYPDLDTLVTMMKKTKGNVVVHEKNHRYHFGTHSAVKRAVATEYLIIGTK